MTNNTMKLLEEFNRYFTSGNDVDVPARISVSRDEWRQLYKSLKEQNTQPADVTDEQILEATLHIPYPREEAFPDEWQQYEIAVAHAVLAMRPVRVPMTALPEGDVTYFDGRGDAVDGYTAERVWEILRSHGITAQCATLSADRQTSYHTRRKEED